MAWMKRQDNSGGVQGDYLNAADTATRPMAIASLLLTLILIGAIALMLFSVGRWAYNRFNQNDATVATTSESQPADANVANQNDSSQQSSTSMTPEDTSDTSQSQQSTASSTESSTQQSSNSQTSQSESSATTTTPSTGASLPETVPNTGPSSVVVYFLLASVIATIAAYGWQLQQNRTQ